jgi:predicted Zn-dependent protease
MTRTEIVALLILVFCVSMITTCARAPETGRLQFIMVGDDTMNKLGADAYQEIQETEKISEDPRLNEIVKHVGSRIAAASDRTDYEWEFIVIDDSTMVNAFALPGGKVAVYTGILPIAQTEAGLAVVMGHEVAHATARHGAERVSQQLGASLVLNAAQFGLRNNENRGIIMAGIGLGATVGVLLPYSRTHESEADKIGIRYMARAGYDPREAPRFWQRMNESAGGKRPPAFLSTHPTPEKRVAELERLVADAMETYYASPRYGLGGKILKDSGE